MKAVRIHEFGGPEVLKFEDVPQPQLRKDQVLVRVKAVALNHLDLFIRKGLPNVKLPHINGSDVSGDIAEVGEYITDLKPGQRVLLAPMTFCGVCAACQTSASTQPPPMVPTMEPSSRTSILAVSNEGMEPRTLMIVASAPLRPCWRKRVISS